MRACFCKVKHVDACTHRVMLAAMSARKRVPRGAKNVPLQIRLPPEEQEMIRRAAAIEQRELSVFCRRVLMAHIRTDGPSPDLEEAS